MISSGGITGDFQVNDTDLHHDLKSSYQQESLLMIEKLRSNPDKILLAKMESCKCVSQLGMKSFPKWTFMVLSKETP